MLLVAAAITWHLFAGDLYTSANIFSHMILGPETFYESFHGTRHNVYPAFDTFMFYIKAFSSFLTMFVLLSGFITMLLKNKWRTLFKPDVVFLITLVFAYAFMILITESYFDRYHIPLITMAVLLTAYLAKMYAVDLRLAIVPLVFWAWVSVAGTKDYMALNRQKWSAYNYLRHDLKIEPDKINGGLEVNCWNDSYSPGWRDFINLDSYPYLLQFNKEKGFVPLKAYEFQRYFPYKKDKIYIFVREDEKK